MRMLSAFVGCLVFAAAAAAQTASYRGYAYADCTPAKTPAVRLVLLQGVVPDGIPARPPRPSIEILVYTGVDAAVGKPVTVSPEPAPGDNAVARSCPVVGSCGAANTGTLTIARGEAGAVTGDFRAQWGNALERRGRFDLAWRENPAACK